MFSRIISLQLIVLFFNCTPSTTEISTTETNEFQTRYNMTYERLTSDLYHPVFTESFILADVNIDPENQRRFSEFSGDLSGRYIEAMSIAAIGKDLEFLHEIVKQTISFQKPDGRFGNSDLSFSLIDISGEHMALLWGNGRMLVGLMEYYNRFQDPEVLNAAIKLGDFYLTVYDACATPETIQKLEGFGAQGIICFTQYIEGMVSLAKITGKSKYIEVCKDVYPLLPDRNRQHTHGYLTTLRGVLLLYEYTQDLNHLNFVKQRFTNLVNSSDFTIFGSVPEYFGGKGLRDEGCASSDFIRLGIELYRITRDHKFLEIAEFGLFNAFYFNQYKSGDFGHHILTPNTSIYSPNFNTSQIKYNGAAPSYPMAAWWCCTMHGMRCFSYLNEQMIELQGDSALFNLYLETDYKNDDFSVNSTRIKSEKFQMLYQLNFKSLDNKTIFLRKPNWASEIEILINDQNIDFIIDGKYIKINEDINSQDRLLIGFNFNPTLNEGINIEMNTNKEFSSSIIYGPFLMGIDDNIDPVFTSEPNNNKISFVSIKTFNESTLEDGFDTSLSLEAQYHHSGFPSTLNTILRPVKDLAFEKRPALFLKFDFIYE